MTADDQNSLEDPDSDSEEPSIPAPTTETRSNSTATTLCAADPPASGSLVSTPLSEERLWELLNTSAQYAQENFCQAMDGRLAEMLRFYATLHWGPSIRGRTTFKRRLDAARSFEDVLSCNEPVPADTLTEAAVKVLDGQVVTLTDDELAALVPFKRVAKAVKMLEQPPAHKDGFAKRTLKRRKVDADMATYVLLSAIPLTSNM
ncbi:hypothetical protein PHMEG_00029702, partial [Phytophthora megakarya]